MTRRELLARSAALASASFPLAAQKAEGPARLIAHRGGVVEGGRAENSAAAMQEAIRRSYWMVEIDLRPTRDGRLVLHHDNDLRKRFGDSRRVEDLTLDQCRTLRGAGGDRLLTLEEACEMAAGKTRFMLDAKGEAWPSPAYELLSETLVKSAPLEPLWVLGGDAVKRRLERRSESSVSREGLQRLLDNGEHIHGLFLFELAGSMNEESLELARSVSIPAVAAVNAFRYAMAKVDEEKGAAADIARLRALGVTYFQIDSRYERLFAQ